MVFRQCTADQRARASTARERWLHFQRRGLPECVRHPYVLWPLQLIGDRVNRWDLAIESWNDLIIHFRKCLPSEYRLILKHHPRSKSEDHVGVEVVARQLPKTYVIDAGVDLRTLIEGCSAVAGVNSSVLTEARLMFLKPAFAYGRSWFTGHSDLIMPISHRFPERVPGRWGWLENPTMLRDERLMDYANWYLYQLLVRQKSHDQAQGDNNALKKFVDRLSYRSFIEHGEEIFS